MVWIPLANGDGQVLAGVKLEKPNGDIVEVTKTKRIGINRYRLFLDNGEEIMNHEIRVKKDPKHIPWKVYGDFLTPEEIAEKFGSKYDPDANKPRPERESFWRMTSRPGSHNYRQKVRLMKEGDPKYTKYRKHWLANVKKLKEEGLI